jgi:hypothetical protein
MSDPAAAGPRRVAVREWETTEYNGANGICDIEGSEPDWHSCDGRQRANAGNERVSN